MRLDQLKEFAERRLTRFDLGGDLTRTQVPNGFTGIGEGWRQLLWDLLNDGAPSLSPRATSPVFIRWAERGAIAVSTHQDLRHPTCSLSFEWLRFLIEP